MMRIDTALNSLDGVAARTGKYIRYFGKEVVGDKIMMGLICVILILVAIMIVGISLPTKE